MCIINIVYSDYYGKMRWDEMSSLVDELRKSPYKLIKQRFRNIIPENALTSLYN